MNTTTTAPSSIASTTNYGSFGARFLALIIDVILLGVIQSVIIVPVLALIGINFASQVDTGGGEVSEEAALGMVSTIMATMGSMMLISFAISILYYSIMESSKAQGSIGKMALSLKVTDMDGNRISFGKAFLRSIGKQISGMIMLIGYLVALFTDKKQALHDLIASTLVLKK